MAQNELNIIVCIKACAYQINQEDITSQQESCGFNTFDRTALECGFRLRSEFGGRVDVLSIGPRASVTEMRETLAMGADRAVLLQDPVLKNYDLPTMARVLSAAINAMAPYDLVLFGFDRDTADNRQAWPLVARMLDLPLITEVQRIEQTSSGLLLQRSVDQVQTSYGIGLPAVVAISSSEFTTRELGVFGISAAFEDLEVDIWSLSSLNLNVNTIKDQETKLSSSQVISIAPKSDISRAKIPSSDTVKPIKELSLHTG